VDAILQELVKQLPSAIAIGLVVFFFLRHEERADIRRAENATRINLERREFEKQKDEHFMNAVKALIDKQEETFKLISDALADHELNSAERYKRIGATQKLIELAQKRKN